MLFHFKGVLIKGIIYKIESKDYYLFDENLNEVRCSLRGKFQKEFNLKKDKLYEVDIAIVGDEVDFDLNQDNSGVINKIYKRRNYLSRKAPRIKGAGTRGERLEQKIASNVDELLIVTSIQNPKFNSRIIDRLIVAAESSKIKAAVIINKCDLDDDREIEYWCELYNGIGYPVFVTSVKKNIGMEDLKNHLTNKTTICWGQSGVGKSSLLNKIFPNLDLKIGEISDYSSKGKHTTVTSIMKRIDEHTFVIDTPGIREIDPYGVTKEDLSHYFAEFAEYNDECRFNTCTHHHEPGCAIIDAVEKELISVDRYASYLSILESVEDDMNF